MVRNSLKVAAPIHFHFNCISLQKMPIMTPQEAIFGVIEMQIINVPYPNLTTPEKVFKEELFNCL